MNSVGTGSNDKLKSEPEKERERNSKKVSKQIGEYVDYEEVDRKPDSV